MRRRMTTKKMQQQRQKRNAGSLHCATHDETVSGFGRDDAFLGEAEKLENSQKQKQIPIRLRSGQAPRDDKQKDRQRQVADQGIETISF